MIDNILMREKVLVHPCKNEHYDDVRETRIFGLWIYLMTDCILFCCLFITYSVLMNSTAGGPTSNKIFNLKFSLVETILLLLSSFTYGMSVISMKKRSNNYVIFWILLTWLFGMNFIGMEIYEMYHLIINKLSLDRSGFLSAFFALIGTHSLHVIFGLIWMVVLMYQIVRYNLTNINCTRIICLSLFWHFLDIVWICVFSFVYLMGAV